jgi:hypothetical protein
MCSKGVSLCLQSWWACQNFEPIVAALKANPNLLSIKDLTSKGVVQSLEMLDGHTLTMQMTKVTGLANFILRRNITQAMFLLLILSKEVAEWGTMRLVREVLVKRLLRHILLCLIGWGTIEWTAYFCEQLHIMYIFEHVCIFGCIHDVISIIIYYSPVVKSSQ